MNKENITTINTYIKKGIAKKEKDNPIGGSFAFLEAWVRPADRTMSGLRRRGASGPCRARRLHRRAPCKKCWNDVKKIIANFHHAFHLVLIMPYAEINAIQLNLNKKGYS